MLQSKKDSPGPGDFDIDDYIGVESCVDLKDEHTAGEMSAAQPKNISDPHKRENKMWGGMGIRKGKEYPPPIPLLVRIENLASHMPWVLKRHYTGDGRLILTEEKVRHHEYFRAHRSEGRLMLQLVAVDDQYFSDESNNVEVVGDEIEEDCTAAEEEEDCTTKEGKMPGVGGGRSEEGKWFKYENVRGRDPAFMFGVAVPAGSLRTVRS